MECLLGDKGFGVLDGDTDADRLGGEMGGVSWGVLACDASNRLCDTRGGNIAVKTRKKIIKHYSIHIYALKTYIHK